MVVIGTVGTVAMTSRQDADWPARGVRKVTAKLGAIFHNILKRCDREQTGVCCAVFFYGFNQPAVAAALPVDSAGYLRAFPIGRT